MFEMFYMKSKLSIVIFSLYIHKVLLLQLFTTAIMLFSSLTCTITACYYFFPVSRASPLEIFTSIKLNKTRQHTSHCDLVFVCLGGGGLVREEICSKKPRPRNGNKAMPSFRSSILSNVSSIHLKIKEPIP